MNITLHALLNEEVKTRGDSAQGAVVFISPPRAGSFVYELSIFLGGTISSGLVYDFIKYAFNEAIGNELAEPQSRTLQSRIEPTMGELPAALETALLEAHRPISQAPEMTLTVTRPRGEVLVELNSTTINSLQPVISPLNVPILGHVTRYNTISMWGKMYSQEDRRVVSFQILGDLDTHQRSLITWSLHQNNLGHDGTVEIRGRALTSQNSSRVKRYLVESVIQRSV
ncbi:hypothetical protein CEE60_19375 [Stenotrophomonas maltophilia]|uniref:Uncharacterized protein n=1 Tax=Stenotrophomonas maltophilia TaxID=40324 RepID=A0A246HHJ3_STEMA|nr:hypothetical protein [Stenotrophomonas maltophilia]OWQ49580.1 hypothetical protein CEE60_19375 [Stenotrophomonas maltophilia]